MSAKSEQRIKWRRDKVKELSVKGFTQRRIADTLKVSLALVNEDLQHLRLKAKDNISKYLEYENCLDGLNDILTEVWSLSTDADSDKRERMQALSLAKECYAMKLDLLSSATVIDRAVRFVDRHKRNDNGASDNSSSASVTQKQNDAQIPIPNYQSDSQLNQKKTLK